MEKEKARGVKIYGILWIILSIGLLFSMPVVLLVLSSSLVVKGGPAFLLLIGSIGLALNIIGIFVGIGLMNFKKWAKNVLFIFVLVDLISICTIFRHKLIFIIDSLRMGGISLLLQGTSIALGPSALLFYGIIVFLLSNIYYFTRPKIKELFT